MLKFFWKIAIDGRFAIPWTPGNDPGWKSDSAYLRRLSKTVHRSLLTIFIVIVNKIFFYGKISLTSYCQFCQQKIISQKIYVVPYSFNMTSWSFTCLIALLPKIWPKQFEKLFSFSVQPRNKGKPVSFHLPWLHSLLRLSAFFNVWSMYFFPK